MMGQPVRPSEQEQNRYKHFSDILNALQIVDHLKRHLEQFSQPSPEIDAAKIKVRDTFGYIMKLHDQYEKDEEKRIKEANDAVVKEAEARRAESDRVVALFQKEQEERIAKRAAELLKAEQNASVEGEKSPEHPEPN